MTGSPIGVDTLEYLGVKLRRITVPRLIAEIHAALAGGRTVTASYFGFHTANIVASSRTAEETFRELDILDARRDRGALDLKVLRSATGHP